MEWRSSGVIADVSATTADVALINDGRTQVGASIARGPGIPAVIQSVNVRAAVFVGRLRGGAWAANVLAVGSSDGHALRR